jgi:tRNA(adenine34) deaminase
VYQDQIIAQAHNQTEARKSALAHAELLVLEEAARHYGRWRLIRDTTLFVTLEPCSMCAGALVLSRISKVVYALADPKSGACGSVVNLVQKSMLNHQLEVVAGIRQEEARELLRNFFQWRRQSHVKTTTRYYW